LAAFPAADAAFADANPARAAVDFARATRATALAAANKDAPAAADAASISKDAAAITKAGATAVALLPLWPEGEPAAVGKAWASLKAHLLAADEGWEVWTDWYDARLRGDPVDVELETKRVILPKRWNDGPAAVNAEIKAIIEEHEASKRGGQGEEEVRATDEDPSIDDLLASPILQTAYADFEIEEDTGTVRMVPMPGDLPAVGEPDLALDWRSRLEGLSITPRALIEDIRESGRNVPPSLFRDLDRYADEADRGPDGVRPGVLDMFGRYIVAAGDNADIAGALGDYLGTKLSEVSAAHRRLMQDYHAQVTSRLQWARPDLPDDATPEAVSASIEAVSESLKTEPWAGLRASRDFTDLLDAQKEAFRAAATAMELTGDAEAKAAVLESIKAEEVSTLAMIARLVLRLREYLGSRSPLARRVGYAGSVASLVGLAEMAVPGSVIPQLLSILRWIGVG
jgi:hypothetical protein